MQKNLNNDDNRPCKRETFIHYFERASHSHIERIPKTFLFAFPLKARPFLFKKTFCEIANGRYKKKFGVIQQNSLYANAQKKKNKSL